MVVTENEGRDPNRSAVPYAAALRLRNNGHYMVHQLFMSGVYSAEATAKGG